jgi:membrane AbrB-like protein
MTVRAQWAIMLALSIAIAVLFEAIHLPAALLLGPMLAAIAIAAMDGRVRIPQWPFVFAQGAIGCLIARGIPVSVFGELGKAWPIFLSGVFVVIAAAGVLGYVLARLRVFPGSTAVWGSSPGAATAMVLMAEANGADVRLVAFMQYLRVVCVAAVASLISQLWMSGMHAARPPTVWFAPFDAHVAATLAIVVVGVLIGRTFKIPAGPLLVPLVLSIVAQSMRLTTIDVPQWLLAISYAIVGWNIGLRFTREILTYVAKAFPRILASIATLIAICGAFGALLVRVAGIDPLTAYLATSPGGADSVAIIAAGSNVDVPFVMTMQTARFVIVLLVGPALSKFIARQVEPNAGAVRSRR